MDKEIRLSNEAATDLAALIYEDNDNRLFELNDALDKAEGAPKETRIIIIVEAYE